MILITGATGLVGSYIAKEFLSNGISLRAIKRKKSRIPSILQRHQNSIQWVEADIRDKLSLIDAFKNVDVVIHCAAIISFYAGDHKLMWETNVEGTANVIDLALSKNLNRFIHMSSIAALGRGESNSPINEETQWYKSKNNTCYAETKYMAELEVWRAYEEGLPVVILNPSTVLGPSGWNKGSSKLFKYVWDENRYYPAGSLNYVDVRDIAAIVKKILNSDVNGERFILNCGNVKYKPLFQSIAQKFNKKAPSRLVKNWMLPLAVFLEKISSVATRQKPLITPETVRLSKLDIVYSSEKIKSYFNFEFLPFEDTIAWTCKEFKELRS